MVSYLEPTESYWICDIETNGLRGCSLIHCVYLRNILSDEVLRFVGPSGLQAFKAWVLEHPEAIYVGHNFLSFDGPTIYRLLGVLIPNNHIVDTLVLSYLYNPHLAGGHSLDAWGVKVGDHKAGFKGPWDTYTQEMGDYCEQDTKTNKTMYLALSARMRKMKYSNQSIELEHQFRVVINQQMANGFYFDIDAAYKLRDDLRQTEGELGVQIHKLFPPVLKLVNTYTYRLLKNGDTTHHYKNHLATYPKLEHDYVAGTYSVYDWSDFNIGSPKQRVEKLLDLGWVPTEFTEKDFPKVNEDTLTAFAEKSGVPEVKAIADWLVANGRANMVQTWINNYNPDTHCIHGTVFSCGALTRRCTHAAPNSANIPGNRSKYGHECRALWCARPGRILVGYDAAALEARALAHYLNNTDAADLLLHGDLHSRNAEALGHTRDEAKTDFYAFLYGASNKKLASVHGKNAGYGKKMRAAMLANVPGLADLVERVQAEQETTGFLRTIDGGLVRCHSPHAALNSLLQSCGAILMKRAAVILAIKVGSLVWTH